MDSCPEATSEMLILFDKYGAIPFYLYKTKFMRKGLGGAVAFASPHTPPQQQHGKHREKREKHNLV